MGDHYSFAWTGYRAGTTAHSRSDSSSFVSLPYRCALPESNIRAAVEDDLEPFEAAPPWHIQPSSPPSLAAEDGTHSFYESVSPSPPQFNSLGLSHYEAPTHYNHNNNNNPAYSNIDCSDLALASSYNSHSRSGSLSYDISPPQSSQSEDSTTLLVTNTPEPPVLYLTEEYKALAEPLSAWIADYLTKVMAPEDSAQLVPSLAAFIRSVLWSTMLQPSAIFLALWYLSKFPSEFLPMRETDDQTALKFREVLFGEGDESSDDAACRKLFVCIAMLADRELHDNCFSSATWSEITRIPMADLAALDYCSLNMLNHSLWVPPTAYADWVSALRHYHGTISPESLSPQHGRRFHDIITAQLEHVHVTLTHGDGTAPVFIAPGEQLLPQAPQQVEEFESDIDLDEDGPLPQEYVPRRVWSRYSSESRTTVSTPLTPCSAACAQCAQESYTKAQDQRHQWFPDPPSGSSSHLSAYDAYSVRHKNWRSVDMDIIPRYSSSSSLIETGPPSSPTPMTRSDYSAYSVRQQWLLA